MARDICTVRPAQLHPQRKSRTDSCRYLTKPKRAPEFRSVGRSVGSTNCTPHATVPFFSSHNTHSGRNVCIAYGDARCRFHTPFPYVRAKSFGTNIFLLCQYAFCTGRKRRRANNYAGIVWNLYEAYRFQPEFALRQTSRAGMDKG